MSKKCSIIEPYLMGDYEDLEGLPLIPSSQLHRPGLQNQTKSERGTNSSFQHEVTCANLICTISERTKLKNSVKRKKTALAKEVPQREFQICHDAQKVLSRRKSRLPQQAAVYKKLADTSNIKLNSCVRNVSVTKKNKTIVCGENNASSKNRSSCGKQRKISISDKEHLDENNLPEPSKIKHSRASRKTSLKLSRIDSPNKASIQRKGEQIYGNTEQEAPVKRRQFEALVSTEFPENGPRRSKRVRKQVFPFNYLLENSDISVLEPLKKAHKPKEQGASITKNTKLKRDYIERDQDKRQKIPKPPVQHLAQKALKTKESEVKNDTENINNECIDSQVLRKNIQSKEMHVEVRKVHRTRGRPKRNRELTKSVTIVSGSTRLRRSTRQCKVNYKELEDSCVFDESSSFPNKLEKIKGKNNVVKNEKAAKKNFRKISLQENSEIEDKNKGTDKKLTMRVQVYVGKTNLLKYRSPKYKELKGNKVKSRGNENNTCRNEDRENERESSVKTKNTNKNTPKKSGQQTNNKPEKLQSEVSRSADGK